ncbi:hypothetical protein scyTo_0010354 [Scyliorhinus torazame]|uniref:Transcription and mRNA export factor ENY2 n=1 Tax=Scyliorhinus torazame TaxID=75743 RepID=A0A401P4X8_SCYTO|nr:hypothetical protein [Scyliorhinus torazame]
MNKDAQLRATINQKLIETGERERLKELLRAKLTECGWKDQLKAHCKDVIREKGLEHVTVDDLVAEITPKGRALVPDSNIKDSHTPRLAKGTKIGDVLSIIDGSITFERDLMKRSCLPVAWGKQTRTKGEQELWDRMGGHSQWWSLPIILSLCSLDSSVSQTVPSVLNISPRHGSINGATRLTIKGRGLSAEKPFDYTGASETLGLSVQLLSETSSIPCDVEKDSSHQTQIICCTRPLPKDSYHVVVSVDGVPIDGNNRMIFRAEDYYTPTITEISPASGLPGQLITIRGNIFTDVYGSNKPTNFNVRNTRILRVYAGGMLCDLLHPDSDTLYGLKLDHVYGYRGTMTCRMTGTYVGHHNMSFILDNGHGRSLPQLNTYFVSSLNKLSMFQTYAEVTGIHPSEGSVEGGTLLTVTGRFFDETDAPARVTVGGQSCGILSINKTQITCRTSKEATLLRTVKVAGKSWYFYRKSTQEFDSKHLQKGKEYYIEMVLQETSTRTIHVGMYRKNTSYTEQQTADSVSEVQLITSQSDIAHEKQILTLENWKMGSAVSEIQKIIVTSPCQMFSTCSYHWYRLIYKQERTGTVVTNAAYT